MLVKRYHVKDMQEAMDTILKELGPDAVVLSSQKVKQKGLFSKPVLEVMVAYDPAKVPLTKKLNNGVPSGNLQTGGFPAAGLPSAGPPVNGAPRRYDAYDPPVAYAPPPAYTAPAQAMRAYGVPPPAPPRSEFTPLDASRPGDIFRPAPPPEEPSLPAAAPLPAPPDGGRLGGLDSRIDTLDQVLNTFINRFSYVKRDITYDYPEEVTRLVARLVDNQVRDELAHALARDTDIILKRQEGADAREVMEHLILEQLGTAQPILPKKFTQKVVLFVGPTGVGKTTSLVKLAAKFSVGLNKRVGVINTDTYRVAAQEQIKTYTDILDIPLQVVYQPEELSEAIAEMDDRDLIFIDTAGKRPGDEQHREDIARIIEAAEPEDILLCVSAPTSFASLQEIIDTYRFISRYRLVVTKLDETKYRGMLLNLCWYTQQPLAYVTIGQNVPDDIETADLESIARSLLN